ncbi:MAG: DUF3127 domain-containing protein, partial [Verrucomicrobiales bacterium]|nr:DUF3127 domain-containing protein [Verrucomicrobiales bacterium]
DKTTLTDDFSVNDPVKVFFDIRGNEYNDRYYVNLNAWKLEKPNGGGSGSNAPAAGQSSDSSAPEPPPGHFDGQEDDIPF